MASELERVDLSITVRPEAVEWIGEFAAQAGRSTDWVVREMLSKGRKVLELQRARLTHEMLHPQSARPLPNGRPDGG